MLALAYHDSISFFVVVTSKIWSLSQPAFLNKPGTELGAGDRAGKQTALFLPSEGGVSPVGEREQSVNK